MNYLQVKHINVVYYYVKNKIIDNVIKLMYIFIVDIIINKLIKLLKTVKFKSFRFMMRMLTERKEIV